MIDDRIMIGYLDGTWKSVLDVRREMRKARCRFQRTDFLVQSLHRLADTGAAEMRRDPLPWTPRRALEFFRLAQ